MSSIKTVVASVVLFGSIAVAALPAANAIRQIEVTDRANGVELAIVGTKAPTFTVFKLQDPSRLVIDMAGADVSAIQAPVTVKKSGVESVVVAQYKDEKSSVGRVIIAIDDDAKYDVVPEGQKLLVRVQNNSVHPENGLAQQARVEGSAAPSTPQTAPAQPVLSAAEGLRMHGVGVTSPENNLLSSRTDEKKVRRAATVLNEVRSQGAEIVLAANGEIAKFEILQLVNPPRLALDLHGITKAPKAPVKLKGLFTQARFGRDGDKVRVVFDAAGEKLPQLDIHRTATGLIVALEKPAVASVKPAVSAPAKPQGPKLAAIDDIHFVQATGGASVEIVGHAPYEVTRPDSHTVVLTLKNAKLPKRFERSLDASALAGPVRMVSTFNQTNGDSSDVKVVAKLGDGASDKLQETPHGLSWTFGEGAAPKRDATTAMLEGDNTVKVEENAAAGFTTDAPTYAVSGVPQKRGYTGQRINLDFHDIEVRNLLRLIAEVSKRNIVVSDDVGGKVTVSLKNVPWDQALDLILKTKGLDKEEFGNITRVAKADQLAKEREERIKSKKALEPLEPLKVRLMPVNFARAADVAARVKEVLTDRGTVGTDERTNVLIVKDVNDALVRAEGLVRNLDTAIPQVLIESRIVEASTNFIYDLGVQWGGLAAAGSATGNPTGLVFPNSVVAGGGNAATPNIGDVNAPNWAINLPAPTGQGSGGALGFVFGSAGGAINLNLRLSAMENSGVVKTISAPKVATIDNKEAKISQGISIPYSQTSAQGVNTTFIEAKLELTVKPHVTNDGSILMEITATNNAPNPQLTGANGQPSIAKREAKTEVLVKDGDTTVIGGIYTRQNSNRNNEVPLLGRIPILGFFFRHKTESDDHTELLIFITPRILNRQSVTAVASGNGQ